jgi:DNA-directed RNA polymerase subunit beta
MGDNRIQNTVRKYGDLPQTPLPHLLHARISSYQRLLDSGFAETFADVFPVSNQAGATPYTLNLYNPRLSETDYTIGEALKWRKSYDAQLLCDGSLNYNDEIKVQSDIFIARIPVMTPSGSFIINGSERVVLSQITRSPGLVFQSAIDPESGKSLASARLIPRQGSWVRAETTTEGTIEAVIDQRIRMPFTTLLIAMGVSKDEIRSLYEEADPRAEYVAATLEEDESQGDRHTAIALWFKKARPRDVAASQEQRDLSTIDTITNGKRYDLSGIGRDKLNRSIGTPDETSQTITTEDLLRIFQGTIDVNAGERETDDQDSLEYRRVRTPGELIQNQIRIGLKQMEYELNQSVSLDKTSTPKKLIKERIVQKQLNSFFVSGLCQVLDQTNPFAEVAHKRRITAMGDGGVPRDRAGIDMRDVHESHYGRICPIETPEGANCGLVSSMANFAMPNEDGFMETPYHKVLREIPSNSPDILGRMVMQRIEGLDGRTILNAGKVVHSRAVRRIHALPVSQIAVAPYISHQVDAIEMLSWQAERDVKIAQSATPLDDKLQLPLQNIEYRFAGEIGRGDGAEIDYMDISGMQLIGCGASLIPFLENDDSNRALMGANMQRQAVPPLRPEHPYVATGIESLIARNSGYVTVAEQDGVVESVSADGILVRGAGASIHAYPLRVNEKLNGGMSIRQLPIVRKYQKVRKGEPIADGNSTKNGDLALGFNLLVAFMCWDGYNYEDSLLVSRDVLQKSKYQSVHIERKEVVAVETEAGDEFFTNAPPNESREQLRKLDERGIVKVGEWLEPGDILVGKVAPKPDRMTDPEERFIKAVFLAGLKKGEVSETSHRNTSTHMKHGKRGRVIDVRLITPEDDPNGELRPEELRKAIITVAHTRKLTEGDKMSGRHGNKGIVSRILPPEDMPFLEDGTPVDICVTPIGVPSRMNLGQLMEVHLGYAACGLGMRTQAPPFQGPSMELIEDAIAQEWFVKQSGAAKSLFRDDVKLIDMPAVRHWLATYGYDASVFDDPEPGEASRACIDIWLRTTQGINTDGMSADEMRARVLQIDRGLQESCPIMAKRVLYDGRTGEKFDRPVTVGFMYMIKLNHLVDSKVHARSVGPYSAVTQQPVGGKALFGGQRFGEMEVWALEAYSAAHLLRESLTYKSDDIPGRRAYLDAIHDKGYGAEAEITVGMPESFGVLVKELQSVGFGLYGMKHSAAAETMDEFPFFEAVSKKSAERALQEQATNIFEEIVSKAQEDEDALEELAQVGSAD